MLQALCGLASADAARFRGLRQITFEMFESGRQVWFPVTEDDRPEIEWVEKFVRDKLPPANGVVHFGPARVVDSSKVEVHVDVRVTPPGGT